LFPAGTGAARGIWGGAQPIFASDNVIANLAGTNGAGILGGHVKSVCRANTVTNFSDGFQMCVDAGGNVSN
jgi:hypothetical protein